MKNFNLFLSFILISVISISCSTHALEVKGTMEGANNLTVYFDRLGIDNSSQALETTKTNANGSYSLHFDEPLAAGPYRLRFGGRAAEIMLNGTETEIEINGSLDGLKKYNYTIGGSMMSEEYVNAMQEFASGSLNVDKFSRKISNDMDPLVAMAIATKVFKNSPSFATIHRSICNRLSEQYPDLDCTKTYNDMVLQLEAQAKKSSRKYAVSIGQEAPDIALPDVNGKVRKLSDLRGQVVLLDFWASWCGPCRRSNPKVVDAYNKYNKKGFTVFNVSLDGLDTRSKKRLKSQEQIDQRMEQSKQKWLAAIKKDGLVWDNHVSDLKKWESEAIKPYGVRSIPTTFLIDREGNIAALNPKANLQTEIEKLL